MRSLFRVQLTPSALRPLCSCICRVLLSQRKTPGKASSKGHNGAVENAVAAGDQIMGDDRIARRTPEDILVSGRPIFPGDVG